MSKAKAKVKNQRAVKKVSNQKQLGLLSHLSSYVKAICDVMCKNRLN